MCLCMHAYMRACVCMQMHACFEHYTCVCGCMSVEEAGVGVRGRECESEIYTYISFTFYFILNVPS